MDNESFEGSFDEYCQNKGNNKPYCVVFESDTVQMKKEWDFSFIPTIELTLRLFGNCPYSIILPKTLVKLTIEMWHEDGQVIIPQFTYPETGFKEITFSSIQSNDQIEVTIPQTVNSISFLTCCNIICINEFLQINSLEVTESNKCCVQSKHSQLIMSDNELFIKNINEFICFALAIDHYQSDNVKMASITTSNQAIHIDSKHIDSLSLAFDASDISDTNDIESTHMDLTELTLNSLELTGYENSSFVLPNTLSTLTLSYCKSLWLSTLTGLENELDVSTECCEKCMLNNSLLPSDSPY
ncbi:hypothetical protein EHI8A_021230 [Entamoeba histolytica HM-1:IMSS-B]|uniref:Uncharacterized protein n=6 Tax=Entamoeba histolytica TaxID=5759 RepID=C4LT15_ENTH1|nr:hypothetical protein EHI_148450 [Entamoeba histolytica HM-1:IMSS]EMD42828.1 Hypothetical protein EHI5A_004230 [Entamoeba histolytica KU27]EMH73899.1 hypothetical protein EHI8A_021230 [Entamoeba histolytica HM-1:IMSS-B]EMS11806.1 hypothetical protein KM1_054480 [Entamoeba histolytica HM-3:IMSS]ENY64331.1 hypothetical protein EHI7A_024140 [Entamoeba histolytica HM-1:IMSS-A]GAT91683.1 hypothetical protein CL6EHI_148450 [Entamoeba histolytica]|eukprot:XP_657494.1 hypothetical protein EHI_148450 [Entamoeba histolytica HM-1:IMSS]